MLEEEISRYGQNIRYLDIYKHYNNLVTISLVRCNISVVDIDLPNLCNLILINNEVHTIRKIPQSLTTLKLDYNNVVRNFADLSNLEYLSLRSNKIVNCDMLSSLTSKCDLLLDNNTIETINLLPIVKSLSICETKVKSLDGIFVLNRIYINYTKIKYVRPAWFIVSCSDNKIRSYRINMSCFINNRIKSLKRSLLCYGNKIKDYSYIGVSKSGQNKFLNKIHSINEELANL
jgi:hypothetical protein